MDYVGKITPRRDDRGRWIMDDDLKKHYDRRIEWFRRGYDSEKDAPHFKARDIETTLSAIGADALLNESNDTDIPREGEIAVNDVLYLYNTQLLAQCSNADLVDLVVQVPSLASFLVELLVRYTELACAGPALDRAHSLASLILDRLD